MSWLTDNIGYVAFFVLLMLVLLGVLAIISGRYPDLLAALRGGVGVG
jgi:hypothetical protein